METLVGFTVLAGVGRVHGDAVGAAVDLGRAGFYEIDQTRLQAA